MDTGTALDFDTGNRRLLEPYSDHRNIAMNPLQRTKGSKPRTRCMRKPLASAIPSRRSRRRAGLGIVVSSIALLLLVPLPSRAQDVCTLTGTALQTTLETGAADIAAAYAGATSAFFLNGAPASGKVQQACNWECGSPDVITPLIKAFGFLQYNCASTKAPPATRRPTGSRTQSQMGLSILDDEYREAANQISRSGPAGVGDLMRVPPVIENASKSGSVKALTDAVETIPGATWLKFSSTSVNNDSDGAARILIRVPDSEDPPRFEQWIQIAINDGSGRLGRNVDFLARQLPEDSSMVAFEGYSRTASGFVPEGDPSHELSKCYSCHPSGLRPVIPAAQGTKAAGDGRAVKPEGTMLAGADLPSQLDGVKDLTSHLAVFGPAGYQAPEEGPPFGPSNRSGRAEFVEAGCGVRLAPDRRQAVVDRMDCETCHDGSSRGILNAGTNLGTIRHKVAKNMEAPMPPGVTEQDGLSPAEREILFTCLKAEYADVLKEWMTSDLLMVP